MAGSPLSPEALQRLSRQIALPAIGYDGQARIAGATVAVVGDDLAAEIVTRALAAGGVGRLRLVRRTGALPRVVAAAVASSNPDVQLEVRPWPAGGAPWLELLDGCAAVVRSGFDDDPMLRAAVRLGIPVVVARARGAAVDVVSFRRHGPCPHTSLDVPEVAAQVPAEVEGAAAVVAGELAAAEVLLLVAGALADAPARARLARLALDGGASGTTDLPWAPECFACGGSGAEMDFFDARPGARSGSSAP